MIKLRHRAALLLAPRVMRLAARIAGVSVDTSRVERAARELRRCG